MPPIPYQDLRFNEAIPNTMARSALYFLAALTRALPPGCRIVEAGSLYGCTSWVLSQNAPAGASVICIDPFEHIDWMDSVRERYPDCPPVSREAFQRFTADCGNITIVQGPSPAAYTDPTPVDLFFEDATHKNPVVADNLEHFARLLKPGGILCGDDFSTSFPDVIAEVVKLQAEWRTPLLVRDRVWAMTKPTPDGRNTILDRLQTVLGSDIVVSAGTSGGLRQETSYFAWPGTLWSRQQR
jgi:predicted O-methyltransferase YrrM